MENWLCLITLSFYSQANFSFNEFENLTQLRDSHINYYHRAVVPWIDMIGNDYITDNDHSLLIPCHEKTQLL